MSDYRKTKQQETGIGRPPRLTWEVFQAMCARLAQTGAKFRTAEEFGFTGSSINMRLRELDEEGKPEWREAWNNAHQLYTESLEAEAHRRAVVGVEEPVFYQGVVVGHITKHSDRLLELQLKANAPEKYRDNVKLDAELNGGVLLVPGKMSVEEWLASQGGDSEADEAGD